MIDITEAIAQDLFHEKVSRLRSTITSGGLMVAGMIAMLPMVSTSTPVEMVQYCTVKVKKCPPRWGIARMVDQERMTSSLFYQNVKILGYRAPDQSHSGGLALAGSGLMMLGLGVFANQTKKDLVFLQAKYQAVKRDALITEYAATKEVEVATHYLDGHAAQVKGEGAFWLLNQLPREEQMVIGSATQNQVNLGQLHYQYQVRQLEVESARLEVEKRQLESKLITPVNEKKLSPVGEIIDQLGKWEDGWLSKIITGSKPLIINGSQGSGKTWTACGIALIRMGMGSTVEYLLDRHYCGDNQQVWQYLKPKKSATTDGEIESSMEACVAVWKDRIASRPRDKIQVIVDEFTHLPKLVGETATQFIELGLSDTRKANCQLLLISHNLTNNSFGAGTKDYRTSGSICFRKFSADGLKPLARVQLPWGLVDKDGNDLKDAERSLPEWFTPKRIYDHLSGKVPISFE